MDDTVNNLTIHNWGKEEVSKQEFAALATVHVPNVSTQTLPPVIPTESQAF